MDTNYSPPTALTVLAGIFLCIGALSFLALTFDIIIRKGWRSMMWVMIPVYPINAAYLGPITLYIYWKYGRPAKPDASGAAPQPHCHGGGEGGKEKDLETGSDASRENSSPSQHEARHVAHDPTAQDTVPAAHAAQSSPPEQAGAGAGRSHCHKATTGPKPEGEKAHCHESNPTPAAETSASHCHHSNTTPEPKSQETNVPHCHAATKTRPFLATVLVGVSHCGAGCVLGDIVGEWLVYGTNATINGQGIWVELLVDYAFALLFGILFQYFSIAPMSGEYGPKSVWRAAKADILSLTSFEVGAFGWMVAFQVGIFGYKLGMDTWTYWWMMQVGMAMGFCTAIPVNWFLLKWGVKEACC